jgi:drug/metabolite transporter (DMT)-like permease
LLAGLASVAMSAFIKHIGQNIPVIEILFIRQFLVLLIISPVIIRNLDTVFKTNVLPMHFLRSLFSLIAMITGFTAVVYMPLAEVTAISFVRTLFTTVLAIIFLKEVVGIRRWSSVVIGFIGVVIIIRPDVGNFNFYAMLAIISALFVSGINIVMRKLSQIDNPSTIMAYQSIIVTLVMAIPAFYWWVTPTLEETVYILIVGGLMSVMQWLFIQAFKVGEAAAIVPMIYVRLVYAALIGIIIFGEYPTTGTLAGAAIIIASTFYTMHRTALKKKTGASKDTPVS